MKIYFDTNVYDFIADRGEAQSVREYLGELGGEIQASLENLFEIYSIHDPELCKYQIKVLTTVANSFEQRPQSWHQAMEVWHEIEKLRPQWKRRPISAKLLAQSRDFLRGHLLQWENAKKIIVPSSSDYEYYRKDFEGGVSSFINGQKKLRQQMIAHDLKLKLFLMRNFGGQVVGLFEGNLNDPDFYWRSENLILWNEAIINRIPESRDYADWLMPYISENAFLSPSYPHFWMEAVRAHKVNKNRISSLVSYYQLKHKVTHGNPGDQMHACHLLDSDLFFTADKSYYHVLQETCAHFSDHATIILLDRSNISALDEIKKSQSFWTS